MARVGLLVLAMCLACAAAASAWVHQYRQRWGRIRSSAWLRLVPDAPDASLTDRARDDRNHHAYISARLAPTSPGHGRRTAEMTLRDRTSWSSPVPR